MRVFQIGGRNNTERQARFPFMYFDKRIAISLIHFHSFDTSGSVVKYKTNHHWKYIGI